MNEGKTIASSADEVAAAVAASVGEQLRPYGWSVRLSTDFLPRFSLTLEHNLTSQFTLSLDASAMTMSATLEAFLEKREFALMQHRPKRTPNAPLIRSIRENARGARWPDDVVAQLARILQGHRLLTRPEADWLADAGAAWQT